jgi:hypothetical protein
MMLVTLTNPIRHVNPRRPRLRGHTYDDLAISATVRCRSRSAVRERRPGRLLLYPRAIRHLDRCRATHNVQRSTAARVEATTADHEPVHVLVVGPHIHRAEGERTVFGLQDSPTDTRADHHELVTGIEQSSRAPGPRSRRRRSRFGAGATSGVLLPRTSTELSATSRAGGHRPPCEPG